MSYYEKLLRPSKAIYLTPADLLAAAVGYFKWCEENPLQEEKVFHHQGEITRTDVAKVRVFTKKGLTSYMGVPESRLNSYAKRGGEWAEVVTLIEQVVYTQKFEHAAAGLLNAGMITRDLGIADKQEVTGTMVVNFSGDDANL